MPYLTGKKRDIVTYVAASEFIMYGWKTYDLASASGISSSDLTTKLGHVMGAGMTPAAGKIYLMRANAPTPARVSKRINAAAGDGTGGLAPLSITTFIAYDKLISAQADGWSIAKQGRGVPILGETGPTRRRTALIAIAGGNYAFPVDKGTFTAHATILGLDSPTTSTEIAKAFSGSSSPKPGRATLRTTTGTISSYYAPAKRADLAAAGWATTDPIGDTTVTAPTP